MDLPRCRVVYRTKEKIPFFLRVLSRLFQILAAPLWKDFNPYLALIFCGRVAWFTLLKLEVEFFKVIKSQIFVGASMLTILNTSQAICFILSTCKGTVLDIFKRFSADDVKSLLMKCIYTSISAQVPSAGQYQ